MLLSSFQTQNLGLTLELQIERGWVDPMSDGYPDWQSSSTNRIKSKEDLVTIVIDSQRGIYSPNKFY